LNDIVRCTLHFGFLERRGDGILEGFEGQHLELVVLKEGEDHVDPSHEGRGGVVQREGGCTHLD